MSASKAKKVAKRDDGYEHLKSYLLKQHKDNHGALIKTSLLHWDFLISEGHSDRIITKALRYKLLKRQNVNSKVLTYKPKQI